MGKNKGLGRGLDALLSNDNSTNDNNSLENCPIDKLITGKYQPRSHMNQIALNELAESIKMQGFHYSFFPLNIYEQGRKSGGSKCKNTIQICFAFVLGNL